MFTNIISHILGNDNNSTSRKATKQKGRSLQLESLEAREMLSVNPLLPLDDQQSDIAIVTSAPQFQSAESAAPEVQAAIPSNANAADAAWLNNFLAAHTNLTDSIATWTDGRITSIDLSRKGLTGTLDVSELTALTNLDCDNNQLTALDVSKNTKLTYISCAENQLGVLDVNKNTALDTLSCYGNRMKLLFLPRAESSFNYINYAYGNSGIQVFVGSSDINTQNDVAWLNNFLAAHTNLTYNIATWINGRITSLHLFNKRLTGTLDVSGLTALTSLQCDWNQLTTLDVSKNTALTVLDCGNNQLTALDVSKNTALTDLNYDSNQLATLDVSKNTALISLSCQANQLTALDVSKNTALTYLSCYSNRLTALDVSKNTALKYLHCDWNQLTTLDVSKNTALNQLSCYSNRLTALDVSKNTALTDLDCDSNQLATLDVSKNIALTYLSCVSNQLTTLDVSKNTELTVLECGDNQLTALDVSKNTELTRLNCGYNQLTALDVSKNTTLTSLICYYNQLTTLDVSKNTALDALICGVNQLTALDVSKNTELTSLDCGDNQLTALDVSKNTVLTRLDCTTNQLTALDVSKNTVLYNLNCGVNQLTALDVSKNTELGQLDCDRNGMKLLYLPKAVSSFPYIYYTYGNPDIEVIVGSPLPTISSKPTGFEMTDNTATSISLKWNPQSDASGFALLKRIKNGDWEVVDLNIAGTATSYIVNNLQTATGYDFALAALNSANQASGTVFRYNLYTSSSLTTLHVPVFTATAERVYSSSGGLPQHQIHLVWSAQEGVSSYRIQYRVAGSGSAWTTASDPAGTSRQEFIKAGLVAATNYEVKLSAYDTNGQEIYYTSTVKTLADVQKSVLATPSVSVKQENGKVIIEWTGVPNATDYGLTSDGIVLAINLKVNSQNKVRYEILKSDGGQHFYSVTAHDNTGAYLDSVAGGKDYNVLATPSVTLKQTGAAVTFSVSNANNYTVKRVNDGKTWSNGNDTAPLYGNVTYEVTAKDNNGNTSATKTISITVLQNPTNLKFTQNITTGVGTFSWDSVTGASSYEVYRRDSTQPEWQSLGRYDTTTLTDSPQSGNVTYWVRAYNSTGSCVTEYASKTFTVANYTPVNKPNTPFMSVEKQTENSITLSWQQQSGVTYSLKYREQNSTGSYTTVTGLPTGVGSTSKEITGLKVSATGTSYEFVLTATNAAGTVSSTYFAKTLKAGEQPVIKQETATTFTSLEALAREWVYDVAGKISTGAEIIYDGVKYAVDREFGSSNDGYALGLKSATTTDALLVFRGSKGWGWIADFDANGVGYRQYEAMKSGISDWAEGLAVNSLTVLGHSLGGTLAQWFAADWTNGGSTLKQVETWNAAGITADAAATFNINKVKNGDVVHNIVSGDIVSLAGEAFIDGTVKLWTVPVNKQDLTKQAPLHSTMLEDKGLSSVSISMNSFNSRWFHYTDPEFLGKLNSLANVSQNALALAGWGFFRGGVEWIRSTIGSNMFVQLLNSAAVGSSGGQLSSFSIGLPGTDFGGLLPLAVGFSLHMNGGGNLTASISFGGEATDIKFPTQLGSGQYGHTEISTRDVKLGGSVTFVNHVIDSVAIEYSSEKLLMTYPPLYFQSAVLEALNISSLSLGKPYDYQNPFTISGTADLSVGKELKVDNNAKLLKLLLGKDISFGYVGLMENAGLTVIFDGGFPTVKIGNANEPCSFYLFDKAFFSGTLSGLVDVEGGVAYLDGQASLLSTLDMKIHAELRKSGDTTSISLTGTGEIKVPDLSIFKEFAGKPLADATIKIGLSITTDGGLSAQPTFHISGSIPGFSDRVDIRIDENGDIWLPTEGFGLFNGTVIPSNPFVLLNPKYFVHGIQNIFTSHSQAPPAEGVAVSAAADAAQETGYIIILPDGTKYSEEELAQAHPEFFEFIESWSNNDERWYVLSVPLEEMANWQFKYNGDDIDVYVGLATPSLKIDSLSFTGGDEEPVNFDVSIPNASGDTKLTFYVSENKAFMGTPVWQTTLGELATCSWTPRNIADGEYYIYVVAEDGKHVSTRVYFEEAITIVSLPLDPPANLRTIQSAKTTLALDWNDVEDATGYVLQRKSSTDSDFVTVDTVTESQYVDTNLTAGTTYLYRIQAIGSAFSDEITAATLPASTTTDTPIITSAVRSGNVAIIEWSGLGTNYKYYVFKGNVLLTPDGLTGETSFKDNNATAVTVQYTVYANNKGRIWTRSLPVILTDANVKPEIIAHEVTQIGGIKLSWNVQGLQFYVFRNGSLISGKVAGGSWIDESPLAQNEYVLYVNYIENGSSIWAYSPTYVVQPTTSHAAPAASPLDTFWAEYDYDGLTIDDEMLSAIV